MSEENITDAELEALTRPSEAIAEPEPVEADTQPQPLEEELEEELAPVAKEVNPILHKLKLTDEQRQFIDATIVGCIDRGFSSGQHVAYLAEYALKMGSSVPFIGEAEAIDHQARLYRSLRGAVIECSDEYFTRVWSAVLMIVAAHMDRGDAFHTTRAARWVDRVNLSGDELQNWLRLLNLIVTTANPVTREKEKKLVNLAKTLQGEKAEIVVRRLNAYYA